VDYKVRCGQKKYRLSIDRKDDFSEETAIDVAKNTYRVKIHEKTQGGDIRLISVNNKLLWVKVSRRPDGLPSKVMLNGTAYPVEIEKVESTRFKPEAPRKQVEGRVSAILPGQITRIYVNAGEKVRSGQPLLVLEAMKMENEITAPRDGIVHALNVRPEQLVSKGELLLEIEDN